MTREKRKTLKELRGRRELRWVLGHYVRGPAFIIEIDDALSAEELLKVSDESIARSINPDAAEIAVELFNAAPALLDALDEAEAERDRLRKRVEELEKEAKQCEQS